LQEAPDLLVLSGGIGQYADARGAPQDVPLHAADLAHHRIAGRHFLVEDRELAVEQQAEVRVGQRVADEEHGMRQEDAVQHRLEGRVGVDDPAVVLRSEDHAVRIAHVAVRLEQEERAVEQQRPLLGQVDARGGLGDPALVPAGEGVLQQRVEVGGDDARVRSRDDRAIDVRQCALALQVPVDDVVEAAGAQ